MLNLLTKLNDCCPITLPVCYNFFSFFTENADLKDVIEYLHNLSFSQFTQLGLQLGLLHTTLANIPHSVPLDYGTNVMSSWLKLVDNAQPTWNNLIKALKKDTVQGKVQAAKILKDLKDKTLI